MAEDTPAPRRRNRRLGPINHTRGRQNKGPDGLSDGERQFIIEYTRTGFSNIPKAGLLAGYGSIETIYSIMKRPRVKAALLQAQARLLEKALIRGETVLENVQRIGDRAEGAHEFGAALKAQELLGKHLGLWVDKVETQGTVSIAIIDPYAEAPTGK